MKIISLKPGALRLFVLLVVCLCSVEVFAQNVRARTGSDSITVGEIFDFSLIIQLDQEYQKVEFPDTNAFPSSLELIERQQFKITEFSDSLIYKLQFFGDENLRIPSLPVTLYTDEDSTIIYTKPLLVHFKPVVAEGDTTLKPMKPNFAFPRPWWPWVLAGAVLVAFLIWWFKFRKAPEKIQPAPEPEVKLFHNPLKELEHTLAVIKKESNVAETKDFKLFYSEIGDAIRTYFEELYNIPALESTSTELLRYLDAYGVDDILNEKSRTILRRADLVKFAKYTPTLDDAWDTYDQAKEFLERAKQTDSARISRLKKKYEEQFIPSSSQKESEVS